MVEVEWAKIATYVTAGVCMGIGTLGPALGCGFIGGKACESIGKKPESYSAIMRIMLLALVFVEAAAIYALMISILLLFFVGK